MDSTLLQLTLAIVMFATTAIAGFIPLKLLRFLNKKHGDNKKHGKWLSLLSCFSGGVFMGTCFLDIVPHINENYDEFKKLLGMNIEFPLPQFCTCIGFFLVYLIEEACIKVFSKKHNDSDESHVEKTAPDVHNESLNLRNTQALLGIHDNEDPRNTMQSRRFSLVVEETANYAIAEASEGSLLKSLTFAIAMSVHSVLEGFALGVQNTTARIVTLFISLILHKGIEAFSVGLQISKKNSHKLKAVVATIIIYALMTPLGSGLGTLLQMPSSHLQLSNINPLHKDGAVLILESFAAGTFIYVTFLEVLAHEKDNEHNSLKQLLAIFIGFSVIAGLQFAFGDHDHDHNHDHDHDHDHEGHTHYHANNFSMDVSTMIRPH